MKNKLIKLGVFTTHPIQYHVPIWKILSQKKDVDLTVFYFSDQSVRGGIDPGFNRPIAWDVPLLQGYKSVFLERNSNLQKPNSIKIRDPKTLLNKYNFDWILIISYSNAFERQLISAAKSAGIKILMRAEFSDIGKRSWLKSIIRYWYLKWLYKKIDAFCYIGENAKQHLSKHGVSKKRLYYSPYTVDTNLFEKQKKKYKKARENLGIRQNDFVVLFSAKFIPRKEPLLFLESFRPLKDAVNLKVFMMGDGPLKDKVISLGKEILGDRFRWIGFVNQSELGKYYSSSNLFVLPSNHETWGLVVNEAMQFDLPVIVSDQVGCRFDLIKPGKTGFIFPIGDLNTLSELIKKFYNNPGLTKKMGREAGKLIKSFTVQKTTDGILNALR